MLLWIFFALLTAGVVAALLLPLRREGGARIGPAEADLAVYKSQLAELEAERARGLVAEEEVESARVEIARRLLKRAGAVETAPAGDGLSEPAVASRARRGVFYGLAAAIPLSSVLIYLLVGTPGLPARPFAAHQAVPASGASVADLIQRVEARLREHPEDGKGWDVVAPVYLRLERYGDAAHAYAEASRLLGETVQRLLGFAEATLLAGNGVVSEEVRRAAERILVLEPGQPEARVWLALAKEQDGDLAGAIATYREILAGAPADAPWRDSVAGRIDLLARRMEAKPAGSAGGPTSEDIAQAEALSPAERAAFIERMVDGLAERLKRDGKDLLGWLKLVRAYKVLGRDRDAVAALAEARRNFDGDRKSLDEIDQLAKGLGLGS